MKTIVNLKTNSGSHRGVELILTGEEGQQLTEIVLKHLPAWADLFARKNSEYGEGAQTLGPRGQFSDMHRKMIKLKTALWEGNEHLLTSEGVDEILMDLIGHCFLTLQMRGDDQTLTEEDDEIGLTVTSSGGFQLDMGNGEIIRKDDLVQFKRHLSKEGRYVVCDLDMSKPQGMVVLIKDEQSRFAQWTNPDWLEVLI